jgi:hypothetical protein
VRADAARGLEPLTERVLRRLPGKRWFWIAAWSLVPWLNAGANYLLSTDSKSAVWEQGTALVVLNYAALSFAVGLTLWGTGRIARRLEALQQTTAQVLETRAREPFREMSGAVGPLVATAIAAVAFASGAFDSNDLVPALLRGATWLVVGIPLWSFLWTYGSLQLGLDRLGRERLRPDAVAVDPGLGLRPLGGVAFTGLWMLLAWLVPLVLTGLPDIVGVVLGVLVLIAGLATFFLSMVRLHRRMVEVKARELAIARRLYAEAYEPVQVTPTLDVLERQQRLLGAADALEKRAHAIHDWPVDEGIFARVLTIATSVVGITVARLILDPFGL